MARRGSIDCMMGRKRPARNRVMAGTGAGVRRDPGATLTQGVDILRCKGGPGLVFNLANGWWPGVHFFINRSEIAFDSKQGTNEAGKRHCS